MLDKKRCAWPSINPLMMDYHDKEWGVPLHDERKLFEFIILDGMQAGLSWEIILKKRANMSKAFHNFEPKLVAKFTEKDVVRLLNDTGIIRNKLKINSAITNAQSFLKVQKEYDTFDKYIWQFVDHKPIVNKFRKLSELPAKTALSDAMSKELQKRGFKFVGSTICYAFMQAAGMVNDHSVDCFRYNEINKMG